MGSKEALTESDIERFLLHCDDDYPIDSDIFGLEEIDFSDDNNNSKTADQADDMVQSQYAEYYLKELTKTVHGTNRNVTMDN